MAQCCLKACTRLLSLTERLISSPKMQVLSAGMLRSWAVDGRSRACTVCGEFQQDNVSFASNEFRGPPFETDRAFRGYAFDRPTATLSILNQVSLFRFMADGHLARHVRRMPRRRAARTSRPSLSTGMRGLRCLHGLSGQVPIRMTITKRMRRPSCGPPTT